MCYILNLLFLFFKFLKKGRGKYNTSNPLPLKKRKS